MEGEQCVQVGHVYLEIPMGCLRSWGPELGILALWLRMQLCKEDMSGEKTKKAMTTFSVYLPKTPEWKLLENMRKTRDWDHGNPKRAVSREREQFNMPRFLDSKWDGATNYHCGLEVAVEGAEETEFAGEREGKRWS